MRFSEAMESRRMTDVTADAFHSTLYVWGDHKGNGMSVSRDGSDLVVKKYVGGGHAGYAEIFRVANSSVDQIRMYGYVAYIDRTTINIHDVMSGIESFAF